MAKSRVERNQKLYEELEEEEMKNNKGDIYEEKLNSIDPNIDKEIYVEKKENNNEVIVKKNEFKNTNTLTVIAKEINGKSEKKNELIKVKEKVEYKKDVINEEDAFVDPISFTDKLSVEEILREKIEQQEKLKNEKKDKKRTPFDYNYTPEMMQERIKQHEGVDVRKETKVITKDYRHFALGLLIISLIAIIMLGVLLIFKVIKI